MKKRDFLIQFLKTLWRNLIPALWERNASEGPLFPELLFWKTPEVTDLFLQHCIFMAILTQVDKCLRQSSSLRTSRKTIPPNPIPKDVQCASLFRWSIGKYMLWGQLVSTHCELQDRKVCSLHHRLCLSPLVVEAWKLLKPVKAHIDEVCQVDRHETWHHHYWLCDLEQVSHVL